MEITKYDDGSALIEVKQQLFLIEYICECFEIKDDQEKVVALAKDWDEVISTVKELAANQKMYMNKETGIVLPFNEWWYELDEGPHKGGEVNAVELNMCVQVTKNKAGDWVSISEMEGNSHG